MPPLGSCTASNLLSASDFHGFSVAPCPGSSHRHHEKHIWMFRGTHKQKLRRSNGGVMTCFTDSDRYLFAVHSNTFGFSWKQARRDSSFIEKTPPKNDGQPNPANIVANYTTVNYLSEFPSFFLGYYYQSARNLCWSWAVAVARLQGNCAFPAFWSGEILGKLRFFSWKTTTFLVHPHRSPACLGWSNVGGLCCGAQWWWWNWWWSGCCDEDEGFADLEHLQLCWKTILEAIKYLYIYIHTIIHICLCGSLSVLVYWDCHYHQTPI